MKNLSEKNKYYYYYYRLSTIKPISLAQQPKYLTILTLLCYAPIGEGDSQIVDFRLSRVADPYSALEFSTEATFLQAERSPLSFTARAGCPTPPSAAGVAAVR
jgi:hypothetical protein